jgi:hypothetical protein
MNVAPHTSPLCYLLLSPLSMSIKKFNKKNSYAEQAKDIYGNVLGEERRRQIWSDIK